MRDLPAPHLALLACAMHATTAGPAGATPASETTPVLSRIVIEGEGSLPIDEIREALPWREGTPVDRRSIDRGLAILRALPFLKSAHVDLVSEGGGEVLRLRLERQRIVSGIGLSGLFPVFEHDALAALRMRAGDPFDPGRLPSEEARLADLFERKGLFGSSCEGSATPDGQDIALAYECRRGRWLRVGDVEVEGATAIAPGEIESEIRPWIYFTRDDLAKVVASLEDRYRDLGWVRARIDIDEVRPRLDEGLVDIVARVEEGKRLVLELSGNEALDDEDLLDALPFRSERGDGYFLAEEGTEKIRRVYEEAGYPDAAVEFERREGERDVTISYRIDEGDKSYIEEVRFEGNDAVSAGDLRKAVAGDTRRWLVRPPLWLTSLLERDRDAIASLYRSRGFAEVAVSEAVRLRGARGLIPLFRIEEGRRFVVASVDVRGAPARIEGKASGGEGLRAGDEYVADRVQEERRAMVRSLQAAGHLDARVEVDERRHGEEGRVEIVFVVEPGPLYRTSAVFTMGTVHTREGVIRDALLVEAGDVLTPKAMAGSQDRLRALEVFEAVQMTPVGIGREAAAPGSAGEYGPAAATNEASVPVLLRLRERPRVEVEAGFGYDTDRGASGSFAASRWNLFGRAVRVTAEGKLGERDRQGGLSITDPRLLGTDVKGVASGAYLDQELEAFDQRQARAGASLATPLPWSLTALADAAYRVAEVSNVRSAEPGAPEEGVSREVLWTVSFARDTRDDIFYPAAGWRVALACTTSARALGSDDNFVRLDMQASVYREIAARIVAVGSGRFTDVEPYGSTRGVPSAELLFAGGANSVRGFEEDRLGPLDSRGKPLGGGTRAIGSVEVRFPIAWIVEGAAFLDAGSVTRDIEAISFGSFQASAGAGLRGRTPVGPIRLDFGYQIEENPPLDRWALHFSFGYPF